MSRNANLKLIVAFLLAAGAIAYLFFGDTAVRQSRRMSVAREHLPVVVRLLSSKPEYSRVTAGMTTGGGGRLLIHGCVATSADLESLRRVVAETRPPVETVYAVNLDARP